ncbi:MAG: hypothetical protein ABIM89_02005 [Mycobacteriales bacterium]
MDDGGADEQLRLPVADTRARDLVAAVQALVSHDRVVSEEELLLATASELLTDGVATTSRVVGFVNDVWCGTEISTVRIVQALQTGAAAGLVTQLDVLGETGWALTSTGRVGADGASRWAEQVFARTRRELQTLAKGSFRELTDADADLFVRILAQALSDSIREAYSAYVGDVEMLADGTLKPRTFDRRRAMESIQDAQVEETSREFLRPRLQQP